MCFCKTYMVCNILCYQQIIFKRRLTCLFKLQKPYVQGVCDIHMLYNLIHHVNTL